MSNDSSKSSFMPDQHQQCNTTTTTDTVSVLLKYDFNQLRKLCETTENEIVTNVGQPFDKITAQTVSKNGKVTKSYLFNQLQKFVKQCNQMCIRDEHTPSYDASNSVTFANSNSSSPSFEFKTYFGNVETSLKSHSDTLTSITSQLNGLQSCIEALKTPAYAPPQSHVENHQIRPPQLDPSQIDCDLKTPEPCLSDDVDNFMSEEEATELCTFLSKIDYKCENGHSVKNFGAFYPYNGAGDTTDNDEIPGIIKPIIDKINKAYPNSQINECLINCYRGHSYMSAHSDNERIIDPESSIFCLSLGQERTLLFKDKLSCAETTHVASDRSLYVMTRSSQDYYTHQINTDGSNADNVRYSLTFRHVGDQFINSTVVIGDSNTKDFKFGDGKGTFGRSVPGKRIRATTVEDINPHDCAGFANVVIVTGTNNLRSNVISCRADVEKVCQTLQEKIAGIRRIRKDVLITIVPVLPTKFSDMNRQIRCYNTMLYEMFISTGTNFNIKLPGLYEFLDRDRLLRCDLSRTGDGIHLNGRGISVLVLRIKKAILNRPGVGEGKLYSHALTGRDAEGPT